MIDHAAVYISENTEPYRNIALEEYLMETVPAGTCILYLWQNRNTVVIGRNQNCWKECRVKELEQDGGFLARRLSGGGAVFHDLGNLNFTFLVPKTDYDVDRQLEVILRAVSAAGIDAKKTGRNDIEADGRKFSGNAFYFNGPNAYHHGTLLIAADKEKAMRYLSVSAEKIRSKGVDSVRSRIVNLSELCPGLTVETIKRELVKAFGQVYGCAPRMMEESEIDRNRVEALRAKFASPDWLYGRNMPFQLKFSERFPWGEVEIRLNVQGKRIADADVSSDAMDEAFIARIPACLRGCEFSSSAAAARILECFREEPEHAGEAKDAAGLLARQNF